MKSRLFQLPFMCLTLLALSTTRTKGQTVVTFDDLLHNTGTASGVPSNYQGLTWSNFAAVNAILNTNILGVTGYYYGMVSASNVASNILGTPAEIDSATNFDFLGVYLTGAWHSNLNIEVEGFRSGALVYDTTVFASATNATLFTFDYMDIDRLYFDSFGGQPAFSVDGGNHFVMDNFTFEFVPEPSTWSLLAGGLVALMLWPFLKRKRA